MEDYDEAIELICWKGDKRSVVGLKTKLIASKHQKQLLAIDTSELESDVQEAEVLLITRICREEESKGHVKSYFKPSLQQGIQAKLDENKVWLVLEL